jgi:S1-C subfamily serine protease
MRYAFGLVSLLVTLLIVMFLFKNIEYPELKAGQTATDQAQQISGRDENGVPAMYSFKSEEFDRGTHFAGITIDSVVAGGPMDTYYGLKAGDIVLKVGDMDVTTYGDYGTANAFLQEAFQNTQSLLVDRGGVQLTLPQANTKAAPLPINTAQNAPPQQQQPANNSNPPQQSTPTAGGGDGLPDQLHHIPIPGGM